MINNAWPKNAYTIFQLVEIVTRSSIGNKIRKAFNFEWQPPLVLTHATCIYRSMYVYSLFHKPYRKTIIYQALPIKNHSLSLYLGNK